VGPVAVRSHRGRSTDVFVSYAREDQHFAHELVDRMQAREREVWVDWSGIPPTAEWMTEIKRAIDGAGTTVFVISPHSASSRVCHTEIEYAASVGKRIVPVLRQEAPSELLPPVIAGLNWVFFRPADDPRGALNQLNYALDLDLEWVRFHTRLLVRAQEWRENGSDNSFLLVETDLEDAERRLADAHGHHPPITTEQAFYVTASEHGALLRQRKQVRGFYLASIAFGLLQPGLTYTLAFDEITETGLLSLAPLWILALAFGASGLVMRRPTLGKAAAVAGAAAVVMVLLYKTVWPLL
jgi:hypothetical protein